MSEEIRFFDQQEMHNLANFSDNFYAYFSDEEIAVFPYSPAVFDKSFRFTISDLLQALNNILALDIPRSYVYDWQYCLNTIDEFGIDAACSTDVENRVYNIRGLLTEDGEIFNYIWESLSAIDYDVDPVVFTSQIQDFIDIINTHLGNKGKPINDCDFSDAIKEKYIWGYVFEDTCDNPSEVERLLFIRFTDELCEKGNAKGLYIKGFSQYSGTDEYPCDWKGSEQCLLKLFEKEENYKCAKDLGYLYYYGRTNNGVPDYEKAFHYFSLAAADGYYEAVCKLGDMYRYGYGCKKSEELARSLYGITYEDAYDNFINGTPDNFADVAMRKGDIFLYGITEKIDPNEALFYYLQAKYDSDNRLKKYGHFVHRSVAISLQKRIHKCLEMLPKDYLSTEYESSCWPSLIEDLIDDNYCAELDFKASAPDNNGVLHIEITAKRIPKKREEHPKPVFFVIPSLLYADMRTEITIEAYDVSNRWLSDNKQIIIDSIDEDENDEMIYFCYHGSIVAMIQCEEFRFYSSAASEPHGNSIKICTVKYPQSDRSYDFISDVEDLEIGDSVIAKSFYGEATATVVDIKEIYESDLPIGLEKYGHIIYKY